MPYSEKNSASADPVTILGSSEVLKLDYYLRKTIAVPLRQVKDERES